MAYEWDASKDLKNLLKHGISFEEAIQAYEDPQMELVYDAKHSQKEQRYFCFGKINGQIATVRLTMRGNNIRFIGATYGDWRNL